MTTIFLGAGFSKCAGVPLASELFKTQPIVDKITRKKLVNRVIESWKKWHKLNNGTPEEYISYLEKDKGREWHDVVWYVALAITMPLCKIELVGFRKSVTITKQNIDRTSGIEYHERFWTSIFTKTYDVSVITTNYDILPERGLRHQARPKAHRPGFNYGFSNEELLGRGYPSYAHIRPIKISGSVPLLKLHGSISWSFEKGNLLHYQDCRPAIRGNAAILAPITEKSPPSFLKPLWEIAAQKLASSNKWIIVGYSLPSYDRAIQELLQQNSNHKPEIHIFDPNKTVSSSFAKLLPNSNINWHPGLPAGIPHLELIL